MPKKGQRTAKVWPGDASDATGFVALCAAYFEALRVQNYSEKTIESREHHLRVGRPSAASRGRRR